MAKNNHRPRFKCLSSDELIPVTPTTPKFSESLHRHFESDALVSVTGKIFEVKVFEHAMVAVITDPLDSRITEKWGEVGL